MQRQFTYTGTYEHTKLRWVQFLQLGRIPSHLSLRPVNDGEVNQVREGRNTTYPYRISMQWESSEEPSVTRAQSQPFYCQNLGLSAVIKLSIRMRSAVNSAVKPACGDDIECANYERRGVEWGGGAKSTLGHGQFIMFRVDAISEFCNSIHTGISGKKLALWQREPHRV